MPYFPTRMSCVIVGDDLHVSYVAGHGVGARAMRGPVVRGFLGLSPSEARDALGAAGARGMLAGRPPQHVTLTCPAAWCALRRVQIGVGQWSAARDEVLRSLDRLLPLSADDALVGLVGAGDGAGVIVAVRRAQAQPWIDALERAAGRPVRPVLTPHMAFRGLGLQHEPEAYVVEPDTGLAHRLEHGRIEEIGLSESEVPPGAQRFTLPAAGSSGAPEAAHDLGVSAALADVVAPGECWPLVGRRTSPGRRWVVPAVAAGLAVAVFAIAGMIRDGVLRSAAEEARAQRSSLADDLDRVMRDKQEAERLLRLLDGGVATATAGWDSVLPLLGDAHNALDSRGFLYRVEIRPDVFTIAGESANETALLERLEESRRLTAASFTAPVRPSQADETLRVFAVRADRVREGGSR